jgi:hypothetical protein
MRSFLVTAVLVLSACAEPTGLTVDRLATRISPSALELTNHTSTDVYWFAIERGFAARADWVACIDSTRCPPLVPGAGLSVPYASIGGYTPGAREAIVYWWHVLVTPAGARPDTIQAVLVRL